MNSTTDNRFLDMSFDELRLSARCDNDVLTWLQHNAHVLPNVAAAFVPYVQVKPSTFSPIQYNGKSLMRTLTVAYEADIPAPTVKTFKEITNCEIVAPHGKQSVAKIKEAFIMLLDMNIWPYVGISVVYDILSGKRAETEDILTIIKSYWAHNQPDISWETLLTYCAADLLPTNCEDFVNWIMDKKSLVSSLTTPENITF